MRATAEQREIFGQLFRLRRMELGLTQEQAASSMGTIQQNIYKWEKGITFPREQQWEAIKKFTGWIDPMALINDPHRLIEETKIGVRDIPVLGWDEVNNRGAIMLDAVVSKVRGHVLAACANDCFALPVQNDTMAPEFMVGEVIIISPSRKPKTGDFVVAAIDGTATLKQLVIDGMKTYLKPMNPIYKIEDVTDSPPRIIGVVVQKTKVY